MARAFPAKVSLLPYTLSLRISHKESWYIFMITLKVQNNNPITPDFYNYTIVHLLTKNICKNSRTF